MASAKTNAGYFSRYTVTFVVFVMNKHKTNIAGLIISINFPPSRFLDGGKLQEEDGRENKIK